jgi:hypothetical protein
VPGAEPEFLSGDIRARGQIKAGEVGSLSVIVTVIVRRNGKMMRKKLLRLLIRYKDFDRAER